MTRKRYLSIEQIAILRDTQDTDKIYALLAKFAKLELSSTSVIKQYHDLLLFYHAFPPNRKIEAIAKAEMVRVTNCVKEVRDLKKIRSLMGSGIAHTILYCLYSLQIAQWLQKKFPKQIYFNTEGASKEDSKNIVQALAPAVEFQKTSQGDMSLVSRLKNMTDSNKRAHVLDCLFQLFHSSKLPVSIKEILYQKLKIYIQWTLTDDFFNRSFLRWEINKKYYHTAFINKVDSIKIIKQKIGKPASLFFTDKIKLLDIMKASLALQYRETDPLTYADVEELELFEMGRGVQIALVGMIKEKRLSLESYIGYMAFKNGLPISYGGGWIWGQRCKIGINIYPPFRGGESAWLFCQIMRLYCQYFNVQQFIVKPYQFGKGNMEGLKSGAFWFYYKLGFRPQKPEIHKQAILEWNTIQTDSKYRTPQKTLLHFTKTNIEWKLSHSVFPTFDASKTSLAISDMINTQYDGDRKMAIDACLKKTAKQLSIKNLPMLNNIQMEVLQNWSLLIGLIKNIENWTETDKAALVKLIQLKQSGKERDYVVALQKHRKLLQVLSV